MASIHRRRGSKFWTAFFRDHNGRQHCVSTKETDKRLATAIANEWEKAAWKKRSMRQTQRIIDRLHELMGGERIARLSVKQFADSWLAAKTPETATSTGMFYRHSINKFLRFLAARAELPVTEISKDDLVEYRTHRIKEVCAKTVNHDLKVVRMLFRAAKRDGLIADDPAEFLGAVKETANRGKRRPFNVEELSAVFDEADPEWQSMARFGLYTGQRLGDIARLTWANLDLQKAQLRLKTSKTGKTLIIPMADALVRHVESLPNSDGPHAPIHPRAFALMESQGKSCGLSNQFADLLAQAGLRAYSPHRSQKKGSGARREANPLSFHSLRHTATTLMHEAGVPAAVVQAMIGHDSEAMHALYIGVGEQAMKAAANALPQLKSRG